MIKVAIVEDHQTTRESLETIVNLSSDCRCVCACATAEDALRTDTSTLGFELTNITVYGGWTDAGRRDQEYQPARQQRRFLQRHPRQSGPTGPILPAAAAITVARSLSMEGPGTIAPGLPFSKCSWYLLHAHELSRR